MARSYRQTPVSGVTTAQSEKEDKRHANRVLRRKVRQGRIHLTLREVSNVWSFDKDGKTYQPYAPLKAMRK